MDDTYTPDVSAPVMGQQLIGADGRRKDGNPEASECSEKPDSQKCQLEKMLKKLESPEMTTPTLPELKKKFPDFDMSECKGPPAKQPLACLMMKEKGASGVIDKMLKEGATPKEIHAKLKDLAKAQLAKVPWPTGHPDLPKFPDLPSLKLPKGLDFTKCFDGKALFSPGEPRHCLLAKTPEGKELLQKLLDSGLPPAGVAEKVGAIVNDLFGGASGDDVQGALRKLGELPVAGAGGTGSNASPWAGSNAANHSAHRFHAPPASGATKTANDPETASQKVGSGTTKPADAGSGSPQGRGAESSTPAARAGPVAPALLLIRLVSH